MKYFDLSSESATTWIEKAVQTHAKKKLALSTIAILLSKIDGNKNKIGWATATSYSEGAGLTKFCLIIASNDKIIIGINEGSKQQASPGRTWQQLAPWKPEHQGFDKKIRCWIEDKKPDRIVISISQRTAVVQALKVLHIKQSLSNFAISKNEAYLDGVNKSGKRSLRVIVAATEGLASKKSPTKSAPLDNVKAKTVVARDSMNATVFYEDGRSFRYVNGYRVYFETEGN